MEMSSEIRKYYHGLLDKAIHVAPEGKLILPKFVEIIMEERVIETNSKLVED